MASNWAFRVFLFLLYYNVGDCFECYKSNGISLDLQAQFCDPNQQPYCLKANVYDGRVIRDCATPAQCPQGIGCAPITYEQDGTTDFVCCCMSALCNSSPTNHHLLYAQVFSIPLILAILYIF